MRTNPLLADARTGEIPIDIQHYDRTPVLSSEERSALTRVVRQLGPYKQARRLLATPRLHRLIVPLLDLTQVLQIKQGDEYRRILPFFVEMHLLKGVVLHHSLSP